METHTRHLELVVTATFDSMTWHSTIYQLARFVPLLLPLLLWPEWIIASAKKRKYKRCRHGAYRHGLVVDLAELD